MKYKELGGIVCRNSFKSVLKIRSNKFALKSVSLNNFIPKKTIFWSRKSEKTAPTEEKTNNADNNEDKKDKEFSESESNQNEQNTEDKKTSIFDIEEAVKYAEEKVKKTDFYAFVIASTLPPKLKMHYLGYHAFFSEILRSRYISKEPSVCRMRLAFWEDSIKEILEEKKIKEPILIILKESFKSTGIRKDTLFRMIDFLFYDLEKLGEINTIEELEIFAENTRSLLIYLTLNLFHIDDREAFIAASHIGRGVGMVDCLKKMPALQRMNVNQLPVDLVHKYGASMINLWDRHGNVKDQFYDVVLEVAAYAKRHIEIGRSYKEKLPKNTNIAFLQAVESYDWLMDLEKYNFDVFEPKLQKFSTRTMPKKMLDLGRKGEY